MDRNLAVALPTPAPSYLRLADVSDTGDGPTQLFCPDPSYRDAGAQTAITASAVSQPAVGAAPCGFHDFADDDVSDADVSEVLEGRLDLAIETNPNATTGRTTTAVSSTPMQPNSIDRTQVSTPVLLSRSGGTHVTARPMLTTPDRSGTQIVERPVMRTPDAGTARVERPIMRNPAAIIPPPPPMVVQTLGVPMPIALDRTDLQIVPSVAARMIIAGRYLAGGDDKSEQSYAIGSSFVLARTASSAFCDDPFVDAEHGALTFRPDGVAIDDFDSTNGVFVRVREKVALRSGDVFRAGEELLRFTAVRNTRAQGRAPAMGSPDPGYWGRIDVMITNEDHAASYPIDDVEVSFGQTEGNLQFPDDPFLGELHCCVVKDERGAALVDLGSPCGTWLRLRSGDVVPYGVELLVGQTRVRVERA